jgi:hypothetical protein
MTRGPSFAAVRPLGLGLAFALGLGLAGAPDARASSLSPFTKGPYVQSVSATSAEVRVEVDPPAPVTLDLGDAAAPGKIEHKTAAPFHVFPLTGLSPSTQYRYTVESGIATKIGAFTTAVPDSSTEVVKFLVYGDNRTDESAHAAIVRAMATHPSDFTVHTGDFVENGGVPGLWQRFFDIEAPLLSSRCLFATVGNHELADKEAIYFLRYFGAYSPDPPQERPTLHRTFRWGFMRFFVLGGMGDVASEKQWLDAELDKSDSEQNIAFRIVVTHYGPWSSGPHGKNKSLHSTGIVDSLRKHHVNLVISGHDHIYERGDAEGLPYLVTGGGGAPSYDVKERLAYTRATDSARHFVEVTASPATMQFKAVRVDGSVIDQCGLRDRGWDCDVPSGTPSAVASGGTPNPTPATGGGDSTKSSSCGCRVVGAETPREGAAAAGALMAALIALFLRARRRYARSRCDLESSSR